MLFTVAEKEGVKFQFNTTVIKADPSSVSVALESGEILGADVIVSTDGYHSLLRRVVTNSEGLDDLHVIVTMDGSNERDASRCRFETIA